MEMIWKSIKLVVFCKLLKVMMGLGLLGLLVLTIIGYSDYREALEKKSLTQAMEESLSRITVFMSIPAWTLLQPAGRWSTILKRCPSWRAAAPLLSSWQRICILLRKRR